MQMEARISQIMDEQVISDRFRKREFVVQTKEQYPQTLCFEFTQDKTGVLDSYAAGQEVVIEFNVRGREWTPPQGGATRYYTTLQAWKMSPLAQSASSAPPTDLPPAGQPFAPSGADNSVLDDDLPF
ncbi:MAG: DUF3127 domain-containing protein [Schleiferiaceae bacterium]|jgi:single-strand DNA-binding protein|tara:strand:- start:8 stop:388 length:381 start_codon:yes stop_codon:yes gene_type:complete